MKYFCIGLLLFWSNPSFADEAQFTEIKEGAPAPFSGRLLNDEAITKLIVENRFKVEQCNVQIDYEVGKVKLEEKYIDPATIKELPSWLKWGQW